MIQLLWKCKMDMCAIHKEWVYVLADNKWLRHRIKDIFDEKGYTLRQFYPLCDLRNHVELKRIFDGKIPLSPSLIEKFAKGFKVSPDRILMTDTIDDINCIDELMKQNKRSSLQSAKEKAAIIAEKALGYREKIKALTTLGRIYFELKDTDSTFANWHKAYQLALISNEQNELYNTVNNLLHYFYMIKDYKQILNMLDELNDRFVDDIQKHSVLLHHRGNCLWYLAQKDQAIQYYQKAYDLYSLQGMVLQMGRILNNLAEYEFFRKNYSLAINLFRDAKKFAVDDTMEVNASIDKNMARTFIVLENEQEALNIINSQLAILSDPEYKIDELMGKFLLMKTDILGDAQCGENIFLLKKISRELKCNTAELLHNIYLDLHDCLSAKKYYKIMKEHILVGIEDYRKGEWF